MTQTRNPGAVGTATGIPNGVRCRANSLRIPQPRRPKQAASSQPRRRISPAVWSTVRARIAREAQSLPPDSPRVRPTLPTLKLLGQPKEVA
jgi:hypothetical protein